MLFIKKEIIRIKKIFKNMISDARNGHVSPGIYTEERDVAYSVKSLGITSLGLVGETLYGPAFQNVEISNWGEFVDYFGGTSVKKFANGNPVYELPFIAKSYLEESKRLNVVRVLGLSGYNAGPVWVLGTTDNKPVLVLRSVMEYVTDSNICSNNERAEAKVEKIELGEYVSQIGTSSSCGNESGSTNEDKISSHKFSIIVTCKSNVTSGVTSGETSGVTSGTTYRYNVSLDPNDCDYIYNVLSNNPEDKNNPIYVEAFYKSNLVINKEEEASGNTMFKEDFIGISGTPYNYKTHFQAAQTPWIISEISSYKEGSGDTETNKNIARKLFRFITISDGNAANYQVKISIEKINLEKGTFNVMVRDFNDSDVAPVILERFLNCTLIPGDSNYIAYKIGSTDGGYIAKSKYILVEMADGEDYGTSIPAGFMGYPIPNYGENNGTTEVNYNTLYNIEVKPRRQYFGMPDRSKIDIDLLSFKGVVDKNKFTYSTGFHMDCFAKTIEIDNEEMQFTTVSEDNVGNETYKPSFINNSKIENTIYNDINLRKFTVCFYGGFDGWDINRKERTTINDYKSTIYKVDGAATGQCFSYANTHAVLTELLNLPSTAITSDYYAYLAGARVFVNPQDIDINILATPGIDWKNQSLLTEEIIDIVEDADDGRGGDTLYIMASPNELDTDEVISQFVDTEINSSHACTYFPWIMYHDSTNKRYIEISATKDVVRNMASTDNRNYPWFAPAGMLRGNVECVKTTFKTTLTDEDKLYEVGINPIKSYAQDGVKLWGNKTTYNVESPLNRINVRRLMIRVKKLITEAARHLIFEQYDETLEKQFRGIVEPILADVKSNRGIIDYRVITESTPETRDQHILPAKILIKPTQALEYISISFVVYPESVSFDENL